MDLIEQMQNLVQGIKVKENTLGLEKENKIISHLNANGVILCSTEKQAKELLNICEKHGLRWGSGSLPTEYTNWQTNKEETCYRLEQNHGLVFGSFQYYFYHENYPITTFEMLSKVKEKDKVDKIDINSVADNLIVYHKKECEESKHCLYIERRGDCMKCFAIWILNLIKKQKL